SRNRSFRQTSIRMHDGVLRILPALVQQTFFPTPEIFNEQISIRITVTIDPFKSELDIRPDTVDQGQVTRVLEICARENHEQRSRINRSVIFTERNFAQRSHFTAAHLVKNFARIGLRSYVGFSRLIRSQERKNTAGDP